MCHKYFILYSFSRTHIHSRQQNAGGFSWVNKLKNQWKLTISQKLEISKEINESRRFIECFKDCRPKLCLLLKLLPKNIFQKQKLNHTLFPIAISPLISRQTAKLFHPSSPPPNKTNWKLVENPLVWEKLGKTEFIPCCVFMKLFFVIVLFHKICNPLRKFRKRSRFWCFDQRIKSLPKSNIADCKQLLSTNCASLIEFLRGFCFGVSHLLRC